MVRLLVKAEGVYWRDLRTVSDQPQIGPKRAQNDIPTSSLFTFAACGCGTILPLASEIDAGVDNPVVCVKFEVAGLT